MRGFQAERDRAPTPLMRVPAGMLLVIVIWGVNFSIIKGAFREMPPFVFNALRYLGAAAVLGVTLRLQEGSGWTVPWRVERGDRRTLIALATLGHVGYQLFFITGLARTTAGNSSLILAMVPLFVGVIGAIMRLERPTARMSLGLALAFAGLVVLIQGKGWIALGLGTLAGDLLVLTSSFCWAAYTVLARPLLTRISPLRLTTITLLMGLPFIVLLGVPDALRMDWGAVSPASWAAVTFSSVFAIGVSYVVWYDSVRIAGSVRTAALSNLIPVVALIAARLILGEPLGPLQLAGGAVVLIGVWLAAPPPRVTPVREIALEA